MQSLIALLEKQLGVKWIDVIDWLREQNGVDAIERKLVTGRLDEVIADVHAAAESFAAELNHARLLSGQRVTAQLDKLVSDKLLRFDSAAPELVASARRNKLEQVYGLTEEAKVSMQQAMMQARITGENPRATAQRIRDGLGLHPIQEQWQANYRGYLERGEWGKALSHELSSGHVDRTIRRLQRDGGSMTPAQIEAAMEARRQNAITSRAETIARTEGQATAHEGLSDAMGQAIARGDVRADQLVREWNHSRRRRFAREDHERMDGVTVAFGEDYVLPDGTRMRHPGDRRGGAKHCANCGCCESITLVAA